jgi:hypothetical protein
MKNPKFKSEPVQKLIQVLNDAGITTEVLDMKRLQEVDEEFFKGIRKESEKQRKLTGPRYLFSVREGKKFKEKK